MGNRILVTRVISVAVLTFLLSGCGVINSPQPAVSTTTSSYRPTLAPKAPQVISVTAVTAVTTDFGLSEVGLTPKTYTVPAGSLVTFNVKNSLKANYGCHLRDLSTVKQYPSLVFWKLDNIAAGTTTSGTFSAPSKPASYEIGCGISPYPAMGITQDNMTATLTVH